jgi:Tol biopolymer transport system component
MTECRSAARREESPMIRSYSIPCGLALLLAGVASAQVTERVHVSLTGGNGIGSVISTSISANGRFVAFDSDAPNLVSGDTNGFRDCFVRDRVLGTNELISVSSSGTQANGVCAGPSISRDGRYVVFQSAASNLVAGDTNAAQDIFVRDRLNGTTERVSLSTAGLQGNGLCQLSSISDDGLTVAFGSYATNLVTGDTNGVADVFVRDRVQNVTERVSVDPSGSQGTGLSSTPTISGDGRFVAFRSMSAFISPDTNGTWDIFVRDRTLATTVRVSELPFGLSTDGASTDAAISGDGQFVVFTSQATNLVSGDTNGVADIFLYDRTPGASIERVSLSSSGAQANLFGYSCSVSADGRYVAFVGEATNLVSGDTNGVADIFIRDRQLGTTERLSVDTGGAQSNNASYTSCINADGRCVGFVSYASNLVPGDTNNSVDAFVRDRHSGPSFTSTCHPGYGVTMGCPCANPPSGSGPGCDNQSNTGGAILSASGTAELSHDTLVFTASGETATATTFVCMGTVPVEVGFMWGQGVRCIGGYLRRLYVKTAVGGVVTAPDFGAGDPPVSVIAATLGVTIHPGDSIWYQVCYRDPIIVCGSSINATQMGEVAWRP